MIERQIQTKLAILLTFLLTGASLAQSEKPGDVWLGVQLAPVPAMLNEHLQLDGKGVMVRNVYVESPADRAGIERYDVIVEANGQPVTENIPDFSEHVQQRRAGEELNLTVIKRGERQALQIVLEAREKDWSQLEPKYRDEPDLSLSREFDIRGHILKPGPEGWTWYDLGEMPEMFDFLLDPENDDLTSRRNAHEPERLEARHVDENGNIIHVERKHRHSYVVTRLKAGQSTDQAEVKEYLSLEELKAKDPEAAKLLDKLEAKPGRLYAQRFRESFPRPYTIPESRRQNRPLVPSPRVITPRQRRSTDLELRVPPRTSFEVNPDGSIDVHVRDLDSELRQTYKSADELHEKAPKLFEKYDRLYGQIR